MAKKIFVSYKHSDSNVASLNPTHSGVTARAYVDKLIDLFEGDEIYKGEGSEDLSEFKDETIEHRLKKKIHDSSVTVVLVSPGMKNPHEPENDQWIPWEIAYSLKEITRNDRTSTTNAVLAVVLPNAANSYSYYLEENACPFCHCRVLNTGILFQILMDNMFNIRQPEYHGCNRHGLGNRVYLGLSSYIHTVKWSDFIANKDKYLDLAIKIMNNRADYELVKEVGDG